MYSKPKNQGKDIGVQVTDQYDTQHSEQDLEKDYKTSCSVTQAKERVNVILCGSEINLF